jgi:hypothetical protein
MNDQAIDQRLAEHAADYVASWRGYAPGWVNDRNHFRFTAEGLTVEVLRIENGDEDGKDIWDHRVLDPNGSLCAGNGPEGGDSYSDVAMLCAWIAFTELIRATVARPNFERDLESKDVDLLFAADRSLDEDHA